jgi:hypothetical protein
MNSQQEIKHFNPMGLEHIPKNLLKLRQAITWVAGKTDPKTGKFDKFPKGKDGSGKAWPKPEQWVGNLNDAARRAQDRGHSGPGIVLPAKIDGLHLAALDWDGVDLNDTDRMDEIMRDWNALGQPYMETSPSGKGLRAFVLSTTPVKDASCGRPNGGKDELFCSSKARWMTVTGNEFKAGGVPEATEAVMEISARWNSKKLPVTTTVNVESVQPKMLKHLVVSGSFAWPEEKLKDGDGRESKMLQYAGHLRSQGKYSQSEIEQLCLKANIDHYTDLLEESVVLDRARRFMDKKSTSYMEPNDAWASLQELPPKYRAAPAMDPDILPSVLAQYVADCAKRMRIPAEMIATPLLVALGSAMGKKFCVQPRSKDPSWIEYPNLWGASILPPAMLKSPSLNAGMKFINELESNSQRSHAKAMAEWISEERIRKLQIKILEGKAKKALNSGDKAEARKLLDEVHEIKPPIRKRFVISDATPEARLEILCDNPNGILLLRDELDGHIAQLKKDGYENARAQELQFFDGHQDYTDDRIKRGSHIAEGPRMALYGNLQPAKVEKYLIDMHKGGSDDGYLQRLLQLAIQPTIPKEFDLEESKPDLAAEDQVRRLFQAINSILLGRCQITRRVVPTVLKFDPDAQIEFEEFLVSIENKLRSGVVSNAVLAAHFGKYRGTLPKLALLVALADNPSATSISLNSFRQAESLLQFFSQHARRIYNVVARYDLASAYELLDRIKNGQLHDGFNPRDDIQRREWPKLRSSGEIEAAIELLERHGYLKLIEEHTGGRPKRLVRIHPELIRQKGTEAAAPP